MYREDYIMRLIERFGQVILYLTGLQRAGQYNLALAATDEALRNALGIGSTNVASRSEREILALIRFADRDDAWRELAAYVAAILHAEATIYAAREQPAMAIPRALLALQLLSEAALAGDALPDYAPPRAHLLELLAGYHLPPRTGAALFTLYEREGAYAQAEDALFDLLATYPTSADLIASGIAFYERLLNQDAATLAAGGLPRSEVLSGLAELRARTRS